MATARTVLVLVVVVAAVPAVAPAQKIPLSESLTDHGYAPVGRRRGIAVYRDKRRAVPTLAAQGILRVPAERLQRALVDYERHVKHLARVAESRILERGKGWLLVYQRLDLPLISDRDFTLAVRWGRRDKTLWLEFHAVTDRGPPPRKGVVRMAHHRGSWELRPIMNGKATMARYQVSIDLAGSLPRWLARGRAGKEVPDLFATVCAMAVGREAAGRRCP